jgi:hypothetical protein
LPDALKQRPRPEIAFERHRTRRKLRQAPVGQRQGIDTPFADALAREQQFDQLRADESTGARDENSHVIPRK